VKNSVVGVMMPKQPPHTSSLNHFARFASLSRNARARLRPPDFKPNNCSILISASPILRTDHENTASAYFGWQKQHRCTL